MPFLSDNLWMQNVGRFWLWIVLTVLTTFLFFVFYVVWSRRETMLKRRVVR
jgi:phosphoglycerol transferase MdoB-like AlkP superfamily enzyme